MNAAESPISVHGKCVVLTGAAGFLGTHMARALIEQSATLILLDRLTKKEALTHFKKNGIAIEETDYHECDIADPDALKQAAAAIEKNHGGINVLINNAAFNPKIENTKESGTFETYPLEKWEEELRVNLTGTMLTCKAMRPLMERGASIINIASIYGVVAPDQRIYPEGFEKPAVYGASKAGVISLTRHLASLWGKEGVRVNAVVYGGFENNQDRDFIQRYSDRIPLQRMGKPEEATGIILFLASGASSYATGATFTIDGGLTAW
ncbi:SDR family oxidoreductase [Candidatus Kaiserbacteria bacterium]|nr:SDR family oxidoreductase [Candidatus Kaiserbacteria bacterium]